MKEQELMDLQQKLEKQNQGGTHTSGFSQYKPNRSQYNESQAESVRTQLDDIKSKLDDESKKSTTVLTE